MNDAPRETQITVLYGTACETYSNGTCSSSTAGSNGNGEPRSGAGNARAGVFQEHLPFRATKVCRCCVTCISESNPRRWCATAMINSEKKAVQPAMLFNSAASTSRICSVLNGAAEAPGRDQQANSNQSPNTCAPRSPIEVVVPYTRSVRSVIRNRRRRNPSRRVLNACVFRARRIFR